jgi:hypothetical protein
MFTRRIALASTFALLAASAGTAFALDDEPTAVVVHTHRDIVVDVGPDEATIVDPAVYAAAGSKILYVNRCEGGETIYYGYTDSRQNTSSIVNSTTSFGAYPYGDASWDQVMADVRDILAPFDIQVTDVDPGSVSHFEIIACGKSFRGPNVLGVAPSACGIIENALGFAFAEEHGDDPRNLAETIAHEAAHTWAMDHLYDCADPMTYLGGCGNKYFQDQALSCAGLNSSNQWVKKSCKCGGSTMNSHQTILSAFGAAAPTPPQISILEPAHGSEVRPGFVVRPEIIDDNGVAEASLYVDGDHVKTISSTPFVFNAPADLAEGNHTVEVRASDKLGASASASVMVFIGAPCQCSDAEVCIDNVCVAGPGDGGFGDACTGNEDCGSGLCATDAAGTGLCTESCSESCPSGFACVAAGTDNVCWPQAEKTTCSVGPDGRGAAAGLLLLFGLVAVALGRSRRT